MRPLTLNKDIIEQMVEDFREQLMNQKTFTNDIKYSRNLKEYTMNKGTEEKARLNFTTDAYIQMMNLVTTCPNEVGWHGTVTRISEKEFLVDKILVFPQIVSGTDVTPNEEAFAAWMQPFFEDDEDDTIQRMRFHGHSHVNMGTTPSGTDDRYQADMLGNIKDYYIFLITNKRAERNIMIYDIANNIFYEKDDVIVDIIQADGNKLGAWTTEQLKLVQTRTAPETRIVTAPTGAVTKHGEEKTKMYFDPVMQLWVTVQGNRKLYSYADPTKTKKPLQFEIKEGERVWI